MVNKKLRKLKTFESFVADTQVKPDVKPDVAPGIKPRRPSPFRRNKPSVAPKPKAELKEVINKFIDLMDEKGEDIKKYL
jgi:hypothetical protein